MSSLNNDVGAVAALSLMIYATTRMIKYGIRPKRMIFVSTAVILCLLAKSSTFIALPLLIFGVLLSVWDHFPSWLKMSFIIGASLFALWVLVWTEGIGLQLRPSIDRLIPLGGINWRLKAWYDAKNWAHYGAALRWQFVTFWSGFGTGTAGLGRGFALVFSMLSSAAVIGLLKAWRTSHLKGWQSHTSCCTLQRFLLVRL